MGLAVVLTNEVSSVSARGIRVDGSSSFAVLLCGGGGGGVQGMASVGGEPGPVSVAD